jgi:hypothetical protein
MVLHHYSLTLLVLLFAVSQLRTFAKAITILDGISLGNLSRALGCVPSFAAEDIILKII